jgi:hypothetical protein
MTESQQNPNTTNYETIIPIETLSRLKDALREAKELLDAAPNPGKFVSQPECVRAYQGWYREKEAHMGKSK